MLPTTPSGRNSLALSRASFSDFRISQLPILQTPARATPPPPLPTRRVRQNPVLQVSPPPPPPHLTPDNSSESELSLSGSSVRGEPDAPKPIPPRAARSPSPAPSGASSAGRTPATRAPVRDRMRPSSVASNRTLSSAEIPAPPRRAALDARERSLSSASAASLAKAGGKIVRMLKPRGPPAPADDGAFAPEAARRAAPAVTLPPLAEPQPLMVPTRAPGPPRAGTEPPAATRQRQTSTGSAAGRRKMSLSVQIPVTKVIDIKAPSPVRPFLLPRQRTTSAESGPAPPAAIAARESKIPVWRAPSPDSSDVEEIAAGPLSPPPKPIPPPVPKTIVAPLQPVPVTRPKTERRLSRVPVASVPPLPESSVPIRPSRVATPPVQSTSARLANREKAEDVRLIAAPAAAPTTYATVREQPAPASARPAPPTRGGTFRSVREQIEDLEATPSQAKSVQVTTVAERKEEPRLTGSASRPPPSRPALREKISDERPYLPPVRSSSAHAVIRERVENARPVPSRAPATMPNLREDPPSARHPQPSVVVTRPTLRVVGHGRNGPDPSTDAAQAREEYTSPPPKIADSPPKENAAASNRSDEARPLTLFVSGAPSLIKSGERAPPSTPISPVVRSIPPPKFLAPVPTVTKPVPRRGMSDVTILSRTSTIVDSVEPPPGVLAKDNLRVRNPTEDHGPRPSASHAREALTPALPSYGPLSPLPLPIPPPSSMMRNATLQRTPDVHRSNTFTTTTLHPSDSASFYKVDPPKRSATAPPMAGPDANFSQHATPTREQLMDASSLTVVAENGLRVPFGELWREQKTVVIFVRHVFCPWDSDYMYSGELSWFQ